MHHLDALLEIKELNAIQWTPGVGEPQGGSPKWYDLYKKILAGGKSIMACWVTLDELRPLLDNIGGDGVHIEMDFHNEREVEQAMEIVDDFQTARILHPADMKDDADREVEEIIRRVESRESRCSRNSRVFPSDRILLLDGAMGTMIQQYHLNENCNDMLVVTKPDIIREIHRKYLEAGSDIIETNTFNAQRISLGDYGLQDHVRDINLAAARLARQCADEFSSSDKPRFVAGSIGPTSRTTSVATSGEPLDEQVLREAYKEQIQALADGGVDALLIETIFDVRNAEIAVEAAQEVAPALPIMLSFSVSTADGHNMLGQSIVDFISHLLSQNIKLYSVGINCVSDVPLMTPLVCQLASFGLKVSLYPNAGMPDGNGKYHKTPESLVADLWPLLENHCVNILGGCCGTTDAHIRMMEKAIEPIPGVFLSPLSEQAGKAMAVPSKTINPAEPNKPSEPDKAISITPEEQLFQAILNGKSEEAAAATKEAIAQGIAPADLINGQMIRAMGEVGQRFQDGKAFVPQLLMAGRAMKAALELLKPMLSGSASTAIGKVVIGTVKGDLHDIGKNLVASMLEGCGFEVVNIGIDVSADTFIQAVKDNQPDILCMSALLTTTMGYMKEVIDALEAAGIRNQVKVMVGGAPVTQGFADEIGADGYSDNANSAVTVAKQLLGKL
jgi:corrinoid protein of di/trimethylamine methyltransferase